MRRILAASLLLSPMLFAASAIASQPASEDSTPNKAVRISSGVTPPKITYAPHSIVNPSDLLSSTIPQDTQVELKLTVDKAGVAKDIQVVKSAVNSAYVQLDERVLDAVRQMRFTPARLDDEAIEYPLSLKVEVIR